MILDIYYSLSPATFLTKICIVASGSAEDVREAMEETEEMLLDRMMAAAVWQSPGKLWIESGCKRLSSA